MSQTPMPATNKISSPESVTSPAQHQTTPTTSTNALKRATSDEGETRAKKTMVYHPTGQRGQPPASTSHQVKFISASEVIGNIGMSTNTVSEISDEELLQMALMFEKQHGQ